MITLSVIGYTPPEKQEIASFCDKRQKINKERKKERKETTKEINGPLRKISVTLLASI